VIQATEQETILDAVFTPDSRCLALDLGGDVLHLREIASGKDRRQYGKKAPNGQMAWANGMIFVGGAVAPLPYTRPAPGVAFSPDGRVLAHSRTDGSVSLWDVVTGKERGQLKGHRGQVEALAFAPDGRTLTTGSRDTTSLVWDLASISPTPGATVARMNAAGRWADLLRDDAAQAYDAILALVGSPTQAVSFLKGQLRPATAPDAEKIARMVSKLDSEVFTIRKKASADLEEIGEPAVPFLRKALEGDPSPEVRKRLEELLVKMDRATPRGEVLRSLRAIEVLETIGTPDARQVLQMLGKGLPEASVTRAAQAALERLERWPGVRPSEAVSTP
jgi:hypothetical protein